MPAFLTAASTFSLPFTDPVLIVALAMGIFLVVPLLFERLRVPGIIGLIVAGAVIGPNGLGLLARDATIVLLGTVGLLYLMFLVGLELDLNEFNRHRSHSVAFGVLSFLLPQVTGTGLSLLLGYPPGPSVLLGAMFASHTLLAYPIASRLGIVKTGAVTTVAGATLLTDMLALLVLAVVAGSAEGGMGVDFWLRLGASLVLYVGGVLWGVPRIGRWFFRRTRTDGPAEFVFTLAILFVFAYLAHAAGIEPIIGALLAGFALNRLIPEQSALMNRVKFVAETIFVPFFLLSVGMLVDVRAFADRDAWVVIGGLVAATVISKAAAAKLTQRWFGYSADEGWVMFGLSVSHAAATMAITLVGYEMGLFDETIVNAVVVIILVTCLVGPWTVERYGRRMALREEQRPFEPSEAPQRILIPIANPATEEALLDLAFLVRGTDATEPLRPLMVVSDEDGTEARVAEAEKLLAHAVVHAAGAAVPVLPLTRVDRNVASGIARGIAETRSTTVIIGWDGRRSGGQAVFGSVLDQLLEQTRQLVLVVKLARPLNTVRRIVLVLPFAIGRHPGFLDAVRTVKVVAHQLGATLLAVPVEGGTAELEPLLREVRPEVPTSFEAVEGWGDLLPRLEGRLRPDDLVVVVSTRRGTLSWHPRLERLPHRLATLLPESFIVVYPPEREADNAGAPAPAPPLQPAKVVELGRVTLEGALRRLLEDGGVAPACRAQALRTLLDGDSALIPEILSGVIVPHARVPGLPEPILLLGVSREGIELPGGRPPARLVFLLLSAAERPDEHLRSLAEIARTVSRPQRVSEILARHAPDTPTDDWLNVDHG